MKKSSEILVRLMIDDHKICAVTVGGTAIIQEELKFEQIMR